MERPLRIGVLALQGAFREHARTLRGLGAEVVEVRLPDELEGLDGLVVPGGESTTIMRLAEIFGRQVRSFEADVELQGGEGPLRGVFIRAPRIREAGAGVEVLGELDGEPVLVRDGRLLLASFHPELTDDTRVHELFLELVREEQRVRA
jgi:5'-phosphate synthase pdxT subunit